ncbi:MAG: alkaline phosphatase family protein, partial [Lentisphaerota bacterium]
MQAEARKLLVVQVAALGWELLSQKRPDTCRLDFQKAESLFPALTCPVQASFRTGLAPDKHGMVANGLFFRELSRPLFWEQSSALVSGPRLWEDFRRRGKKVGLLFWQQSL